MKKRVAALILGLFFILNALPCAALDINPATDRDFDVPCQAAILIDEDSGTVLYEKNADESRPIASITKIMTLLLTFEALEAGKVSLSDIVPVSEHGICGAHERPRQRAGYAEHHVPQRLRAG